MKSEMWKIRNTIKITKYVMQAKIKDLWTYLATEFIELFTYAYKIRQSIYKALIYEPVLKIKIMHNTMLEILFNDFQVTEIACFLEVVNKIILLKLALRVQHFPQPFTNWLTLYIFEYLIWRKYLSLRCFFMLFCMRWSTSYQK